MPRPQADDRAENLLIDQAAEKQDAYAEIANKAQPAFRAAARRAMQQLKVPRPPKALVAATVEALVLAVLRQLAYAGNDLRTMVTYQRDARAATFGKRSKYKLTVEPISKKSLEKRAKEKQAAIAEAREVDSART